MVQPAGVPNCRVLVSMIQAGSQVIDPSHGVSSANPNRAATASTSGFDAGVGAGTRQTIQRFLASGGEFIFKIDLDPTQRDITADAPRCGVRPGGQYRCLGCGLGGFTRSHRNRG